MVKTTEQRDGRRPRLSRAIGLSDSAHVFLDRPSAEMRGGVGRCFDFLRQKRRKPARCHRRTVSGFTSRSASLHLGTSRVRVAISPRSWGVESGPFRTSRRHDELLTQKGVLGDELASRPDQVSEQSAHRQGPPPEAPRDGMRPACDLAQDALNPPGENRNHPADLLHIAAIFKSCTRNARARSWGGRDEWPRFAAETSPSREAAQLTRPNVRQP